ncbi:MAG: hypothetical protein AB7F35_17810 [Acetobacteraceae bacterium]
MSGTTHFAFRRLILELGQAPADDATMRLAADFARGLGLDLHGLFIQDEALLHLAALPFAREIRLPSHVWQKVDTARMEAELQHAADAARRRLGNVVEALGVQAAFEVIRGEPHLCIAGVCTPADIIVIPAYDEALPRGAAMLRAAADSAASILLIPRRAVRRPGPVAAVATGTDDPALPVAARIAEASKDRLVVVLPDPGQAPSPDAAAAALGMSAERLAFRLASGLQEEDVLRGLADAHERMVVLTPAAGARLGIADASRLARIRAVPILVL